MYAGRCLGTVPVVVLYRCTYEGTRRVGILADGCVDAGEAVEEERMSECK